MVVVSERELVSMMLRSILLGVRSVKRFRVLFPRKGDEASVRTYASNGMKGSEIMNMVQHLFYIYSIDCCCKPKNQSYNPKMCIHGLQPFGKHVGHDQKTEQRREGVDA